jgi:aminoglycoside 6'-N-acetyltransferase
MLTLETHRLVLRHFEPADAVAFSAYRSDERIARYQGWNTPYSLEQAQGFIAEMQSAAGETPGRWLQLALAPKIGGPILGDVAFMILKNDPRQAEIGVTLAYSAQRQGYGREAVARLAAYLFDERGLHRLRANIDPANLASARLLRRLGFRYEGRWVESLWFKGRYVDEDWYALLKREWQPPV